MAKFRDLTSAEIVEIFHDWNNFICVFGRCCSIVYDLSSNVFQVKIYTDAKSLSCIVIKTFPTLKALSSGLEYLCDKYC